MWYLRKDPLSNCQCMLLKIYDRGEGGKKLLCIKNRLDAYTYDTKIIRNFSKRDTYDTYYALITIYVDTVNDHLRVVKTSI